MKVLFALIASSVSLFADGKIFHLTGKAQMVLSGKKAPAKLGAVIKVGDQVLVAPGGRIGIQFADGASVLLTAGADFIYKQPTEYFQAAGESSMIFTRTATSPKQWSIRSPTVTAAVRGTGFTVQVQGKKTRIALFEGKLIVKDFIREAGMSSDPNGMMLDFLADIELNKGQVLNYDGDAVTKTPLDAENEPTAGLRQQHQKILQDEK